MGHRPFRELTKDFSPERRARIEEGKARIRAEAEREEAERAARESARRDEGTSRPATGARH